MDVTGVSRGHVSDGARSWVVLGGTLTNNTSHYVVDTVVEAVLSAPDGSVAAVSSTPGFPLHAASPGRSTKFEVSLLVHDPAIPLQAYTYTLRAEGRHPPDTP